MTNKRSYTLAGLFVLAVVVAPASSNSADGLGRRHLEIVNDSGESIDLDWLNPNTGQAVHYGHWDEGATYGIESFVNHTFIIRSNESQAACQAAAARYDDDSGECRRSMAYLTVSDSPAEQVVVVHEGLLLEVGGTPQQRRTARQTDADVASNLVRECRQLAHADLQRGTCVETVSNNLVTCLESGTAELLEKKNEELAFQADLRKKIAGMAENYTCADPTKETTTPKKWRDWIHGGVTRKVGILHDRPASQIHVLHDFISEEECEAVKATAKKTLHRGTVADGKGGSRLSESRKAWQAGLKVKWHLESQGDHIAAVSRRLLDYANHATGFNMSVEGQEDLMSIQYFGNGADDPTPDRYMPHCDGDCNGLPHKRGARVATMVMYCDVPELGGATNFQHANVFVKPQVGAAAFFSYMDAKTRLHEEGFTTHSGCPVLKGTKRIAVQWLRVGVDDENPWDSFDTNTVQKSSYEAEDELDGDDAEESDNDRDD